MAKELKIFLTCFYDWWRNHRRVNLGLFLSIFALYLETFLGAVIYLRKIKLSYQITEVFKEINIIIIARYTITARDI